MKPKRATPRGASNDTKPLVARREAYERAVAELQTQGQLEPQPMACTQCGKNAVLHRVPLFVEAGPELLEVQSIVSCPFCRVDRAVSTQHAAGPPDPLLDATLDRLEQTERAVRRLRLRLEAGRWPGPRDEIIEAARGLWLKTLGHRNHGSRLRLDVVQTVRHVAAAQKVTGGAAARTEIAMNIFEILHPEFIGILDREKVEAAIAAWQQQRHHWRRLLSIFTTPAMAKMKVRFQATPEDLRAEFGRWDRRSPDR